ncbi:MAG: CorA family divalent cation transporter, partial [Bacilli bacterium]
LYKEYMLFMNQIYFREVTSQDQGIEFYQLFLEQFGCTKQISDLEEELGELHNYYHLLLAQKQNKNAEILNIIAATLLPASLLTAIFSLSKPQIHEGLQVLSIGLVIVFFYFNTKRILKK